MYLHPEELPQGDAPKGRILVIEHIRPDDATPHMAKFMDMQMLIMTPGGRERTLTEFEHLFAAADLALRNTVATNIGLSVLECGVQ